MRYRLDFMQYLAMREYGASDFTVIALDAICGMCVEYPAYHPGVQTAFFYESDTRDLNVYFRLFYF